MSRDEASLLDVLRAAKLALSFRDDMSEATFMADEKTQSAVIHQLLVLGEAARRLSPEFRSAHPSVPWRQAAGMRDKLIHGYDTVDLDEVWKTVSADIPALIEVLEGFESVEE